MLFLAVCVFARNAKIALQKEVDFMSDHFQSTLLGTELVFEHDESRGMITDETLSEVYVESELFTGWMPKATLFELSGID